MIVSNTPELLNAYKRDYYVETGCSTGTGIRRALEAKFEEIVGIEVLKETVTATKRTFENNSNVRIIQGQSETALAKIIHELNARGKSALFFLDAHINPVCVAPGTTNPLLKELALIGNAFRKDHVIAIDDARLFGTELPSADKVEKLIKNINKRYIIEYLDNDTSTRDILVAHL